eukprot:CAMPEP_0177592626 /NCGR_PEP_ID=MMETSP0419_2-20121207/8666_1 /TAXON_ID=582737 /ORGANISM="Tetraselmis sp., Strain GSL018" /LENGTH=814 /DNA_ID=CAMNT_0019083517 /DNA_START=275 /DNA_END=2719 /DNA_ORIENTATION=-
MPSHVRRLKDMSSQHVSSDNTSSLVDETENCPGADVWSENHCGNNRSLEPGHSRGTRTTKDRPSRRWLWAALCGGALLLLGLSGALLLSGSHSFGADGTAASSFLGGALQAAAAHERDFLVPQIQYRMQQLLTGTFFVKLFGMLLLLLPLAYLVGLLLIRFTDTELKKGFLLSYAALVKLPGFVAKETSVVGFAILNFTYMFGLFTFGLFQGFITADVRNWMEDVKGSNFAVLEKDHTVVIGWNEDAIHMLRQAAVAKQHHQAGAWSRPVVIVVDGETIKREDVERQIAKDLSRNGARGLSVIVREADPSSVADMRLVGMQRAKTIIRLVPYSLPEAKTSELSEHMRNDLLTFAATAKAAGAGRASQTFLIQQRADEALATAATGGAALSSLATDTTFRLAKAMLQEGETGAKVTPNAIFTRSGLLDHFIGHCAVQPGLGSVLTDLFSARSSNFQIGRVPGAEGMSYGEARQSLQGGLLCGVMRKREDGDQRPEHLSRVVLSPPDSYSLGDKDKLIYLAPSRDSVKLVKYKEIDNRPRNDERDQGVQELLTLAAQRIVLLAGDREPRACLRAVCEFAPPGSKVTVVVPHGSNYDVSHLDSELVKVDVVEGSVFSESDMRRAGAHDCDTAVMLGSLQSEKEELATVSDTLLVNSMARLRTLRNVANRERGEPIPLRVVACVTSSQTHVAAADIAKRATLAGDPMSVELITTSELTGGYMAQVAQNPTVRLVLRHLVMDRRGCEIYIRPLTRYPELLAKVMNGDNLDFAGVSEYLRNLDETVIGYVRSNGVHELDPKNHAVKIDAADSLITISETP